MPSHTSPVPLLMHLLMLFIVFNILLLPTNIFIIYSHLLLVFSILQTSYLLLVLPSSLYSNALCLMSSVYRSIIWSLYVHSKPMFECPVFLLVSSPGAIRCVLSPGRAISPQPPVRQRAVIHSLLGHPAPRHLSNPPSQFSDERDWVLAIETESRLSES